MSIQKSLKTNLYVHTDIKMSNQFHLLEIELYHITSMNLNKASTNLMTIHGHTNIKRFDKPITFLSCI